MAYSHKNRYLVTCKYGGLVESADCYRLNGKYWASFSRFAAPEYITFVGRIEPTGEQRALIDALYNHLNILRMRMRYATRKKPIKEEIERLKRQILDVKRECIITTIYSNEE